MPPPPPPPRAVARRLWDWQHSTQMSLLTTTSGMPTAVQPGRVMCRSCCFSPSEPDTIFSVQSAARGKSYVTRWKYTIDEEGGGREGGGGGGAGGVGREARRLYGAVEPVQVACVSPHPATTMSVRSDGRRLAVGNVEGAVLIYRLPGFAKVGEGRCIFCFIFLSYFRRRVDGCTGGEAAFGVFVKKKAGGSIVVAMVASLPWAACED